MNNYYKKRKETKEINLFNQYKKLDNQSLIILLDNQDKIKRIIAARELQTRGDEDTVELAKNFCSDVSYKRKMIGAFILGQITIRNKNKLAEIFNLLYQLAAKDNRALVRAIAIESLGHLCKKEISFSDSLIKLSNVSIHDKSATVRQATAFALSCINTKKSISPLLTLIDDKNSDVREWAIFAINLQQYDSEDIRNHLIKLITDSNDNIRNEAIIALATRKDQRIADALKQELESELEKGIFYDDMIIAAGELGNKKLLPSLQIIATQFDNDHNIADIAINKIKLAYQ